MKCLNMFIAVTRRTWMIFFRLKIEIGTGEEEHNEKQKENEKDEKKTYNKQFE